MHSCLLFDARFQSHILQFPNEVLELILVQVSDPFLVAEVCKRFYEISCRMKAFKMKIDASTMLADLDKYESVVNSSRKIESIRIYQGVSGAKRKFHSKIMKKILENFKADVKELEILNYFLNLEGLQLLSLMSLLQKLSLNGITAGKMKLPQSFRLRLPNLREFDISACDSTVLGFFDRLDDNILRKLTLNYIPGSSENKHFGNQRSIVDLKTSENAVDLLDLQQLKLKKVDVTLDKQTLGMFDGQDEIIEMKISYFYFGYYIGEPTFDCDFAKFKSLEVLDVSRFGDDITINLTSIDKLPNLRKLKVNRLTPIKSFSLQELAFDDVPPENLLDQIAANCPNLRVLETYYIDVGLILLHFHRLESLSCCYNTCSGNAIHQHLKHLRIYSYQADKLLSIVNRCEVLESLSTSFSFDQASLKNLLLLKPGLKWLSLYFTDSKLLDIIKEYGGNLEVLQLTSSRSVVNLHMLKEQLKGVFDVFGERGDIYIAKKAGTAASFKFT
jgi:hypothetical protein